MYKINLIIVILSLLMTTAVYARSYTYKSSYGSHGSTHWVRPYVKKNGSYYQPHLSANPNSGLHYHNNISTLKTK